MSHNCPCVAAAAPEKLSSFPQPQHQWAMGLFHMSTSILLQMFLLVFLVFFLWLVVFFFSGGVQKKEREMMKARNQGTGREGGPHILPWRESGLSYHFSQGVGAIPDVGLLEVDLPEPAGLMGIGNHPCPFWRQGAGEKKRETATIAEDNPSWEAPGQGVQGGHGSRVRPRGCSYSTQRWWERAVLASGRVSKGKGREAERLQALPLLWF